MKTKRTLSMLLASVLALSMLSGCGGKEQKIDGETETSDLYQQVMARFDGKLEQGAVVKRCWRTIPPWSWATWTSSLRPSTRPTRTRASQPNG